MLSRAWWQHVFAFLWIEPCTKKQPDHDIDVVVKAEQAPVEPPIRWSDEFYKSFL